MLTIKYVLTIDRNQEVASKAGGLKSLCKLLGIVKDKDCLMNMLRALSKMAAHLG